MFHSWWRDVIIPRSTPSLLLRLGRGLLGGRLGLGSRGLLRSSLGRLLGGGLRLGDLLGRRSDLGLGRLLLRGGLRFFGVSGRLLLRSRRFLCDSRLK